MGKIAPILSAFLLAVTTVTGCNFFSDLESEHPFPEEDPCAGCEGICIEGECFEQEEGCDPECPDGSECVDGTCESSDVCDPDSTDCEVRTCEDDPDMARCADSKQCPSGEEVPITGSCPCEEEGRCVCDLETGECQQCPDGVDFCECSDEQQCPDGRRCDDNFQCTTQVETTVCLVDDPGSDCEPCEGTGSCPAAYDCHDAEGVCYPKWCGAPDGNEEICVHSCMPDDSRCPEGLECVDEGYCTSGTCECPDGTECDPQSSACLDADGESLRCETDYDCEPAVCIGGICVGV